MRIAKISMENFKNRLRKIIGEGRNVSSFAKKCDLTEGLLRSYLTGKSLPGLDKLVKISEVAKVSIEWLATGKGEILSPQSVIATDPASLYVVERTPESKLEAMLRRIVSEGNEKKIRAIEAQLDLLDPGEKPQSITQNTNNGSRTVERLLSPRYNNQTFIDDAEYAGYTKNMSDDEVIEFRDVLIERIKEKLARESSNDRKNYTSDAELRPTGT